MGYSDSALTVGATVLGDEEIRYLAVLRGLRRNGVYQMMIDKAKSMHDVLHAEAAPAILKIVSMLLKNGFSEVGPAVSINMTKYERDKGRVSAAEIQQR